MIAAPVSDAEPIAALTGGGLVDHLFGHGEEAERPSSGRVSPGTPVQIRLLIRPHMPADLQDIEG